MNDLLPRIKENVSKVIIGKENVIELLLTALAAGGHVLLEDVPGTGKTVLAKSLAKSMNFSFGRIQFTPDLLPSDVTGLSYYNQEKGTFVFKEGPVFTNRHCNAKSCGDTWLLSPAGSADRPFSDADQYGDFKQ